MKITEKHILEMQQKMRNILVRIPEENAERLMVSLVEQITSGGENKIVFDLKFVVMLPDSSGFVLGASSECTRKVKVREDYDDQFVTVGEVLPGM